MLQAKNIPGFVLAALVSLMLVALAAPAYAQTTEEDATSAAIQHMRVDHRRVYVTVPKHLLDRADSSLR